MDSQSIRTTNKFRGFLPLALLLLAFPLMGLSSEESFGCGCPGETETSSLPLPSDSRGVASSENYRLDRSDIGLSFEKNASLSGLYQLNTALGNPFSEKSSESEHYKVSNVISQTVVVEPVTADTEDIEPVTTE